MLALKYKDKLTVLLLTMRVFSPISPFICSFSPHILPQPDELSLFPLAVANRSAVLARLGRHRQALRDVDLALGCGAAHPNPGKLKDRRDRCAEELEKEEEQRTEGFDFAKGELGRLMGIDILKIVTKDG